MATVAEIIAWAERKFATSESDANLIIDLDMIQDEIYLELNTFRKAFKYFDIYSTLSVAGTLNYTLPSDCKIENIEMIEMSDETTIDDDTYWTPFTFASFNDEGNYGSIWTNGTTEGKIALVQSGATITSDGLTIRIYYLPTPTRITATTQTPDLAREYHNLFKYALVQSISSQGDNPDTFVANYYQSKFNELMGIVQKDLRNRNASVGYKAEQIGSRWG